MSKYTLTLSCCDVAGIVSAVSGFLAGCGGFILESAQFGDESTGRFFMRTMFTCDTAQEELERAFAAEVAVPFNMQWQLHNHDMRQRVLLLGSREDHCVNAVLYHQQRGELPVDIVAVISNHPDLARVAQWHDLPYYHLPVTKESKPQQEAEIMRIVQRERVDLVVLARYMQILSPTMCEALEGRAINIHHSFLPGFKGAKPYHQAYDRGVKIIGATAHYVTSDLDEGPIIEQEVMRVNHTHTPRQLQMIGRDIESRVLVRAVKYHVERRVLLNHNKTVVFG